MRPSLPNTLFIAVLLVADGQPLLAQEHTLPARAKKMAQRVTPRLRSMDDFTTLAVQRASLTHDAYRAAAPSTWIFLIGAYRTFYYVRRSVKKFAELSAPGDFRRRPPLRLLPLRGGVAPRRLSGVARPAPPHAPESSVHLDARKFLVCSSA